MLNFIPAFTLQLLEIAFMTWDEIGTRLAGEKYMHAYAPGPIRLLAFFLQLHEIVFADVLDLILAFVFQLMEMACLSLGFIWQLRSQLTSVFVAK